MAAKTASALEVPMYRLFTDDAHVKKPNIPISKIETARNGKQEAKLHPDSTHRKNRKPEATSFQ
jgi:hypothetical protein